MLGIEGLTCGAEIYRFETGGGEMQVRLSVCEVPYSVTLRWSLSTYCRTLLVLCFAFLFYYYFFECYHYCESRFENITRVIIIRSCFFPALWWRNVGWSALTINTCSHWCFHKWSGKVRGELGDAGCRCTFPAQISELTCLASLFLKLLFCSCCLLWQSA